MLAKSRSSSIPISLEDDASLSALSQEKTPFMDEFSIAGRLSGSLVGRVLPYHILESLKSCVFGIGRQEIWYSKRITFVCNARMTLIAEAIFWLTDATCDGDSALQY